MQPRQPRAFRVFALLWWRCGATTAYDPQVRIESARLYGNVNKYAYYFTDLLIGSPKPQRASVIVDTGSRLVGFPCSGCDHCGHHLDPAYDVSQSNSARWTGCRGECDAKCFNDHCQYTETYTEGSTISGYWFDDLVELGDSFQKNPPVKARLGCHTDENKLFYTQKANGIMGLAPRSSSTESDRPTILQDLFRDKEHVDTRTFSLCLATWGGRLTIGGYNTSYHANQNADGIKWINMRASHYYFIFPASIALQGEGRRTTAISGPEHFGVCIVDSGTTYTYFPTPVFKAIVDSLEDFCRAHNNCGAQREGAECYRLLDPSAGPSQFPVLHMQFGPGSEEIAWPARGYLNERGELGVWCHTFMESTIFQTVLGISWMIHKDIIFDLVHGRLGVAEATCPEHRLQPDFISEVSLDAPAAIVSDTLARTEGQYSEHSLQVLLLSTLLMGLGATVACIASRAAAPEGCQIGTRADAPEADSRSERALECPVVQLGRR